MTIDISRVNRRVSNKLDLKKIAISRINYYIYSYKCTYDLDSIHFNNPIDDITFYRLFPHITETNFHSDWYTVDGDTLVKVLECLKKKDFFGIRRTEKGNIKVRLKK